MSWLAIGILATHTLAVTTLRQFRIEPLSSGFLQIAASLVVTISSYRASTRCTGFARRFWFFVSVAFAMWTVAEILDVVNEFYLDSLDINPSSLLFLFFAAVAPLSLTLFHMAPSKRSAGRWIWIADAIQLCLLIGSGAFAYLTMAHSASGIELTIARLQVLHWRNVLLATALVLRACSARGEARRLFAMLAMCFSTYAVTSLFGNWAIEVWEVGTGTLFDLAWTAPFAMLAVQAAEWTSPQQPRSNCEEAHEMTGLPLPALFTFGVISIALFGMSAHPSIGSVVALLSFALFLLRTYLEIALLYPDPYAAEAVSLMREAANGCLPICAACKMIRDESGNWNALESYIRDHHGIRFSHGICESCSRSWYGTSEEEILG